VRRNRTDSGVLEGECRRAINAVGLEPSVGFLHETSGYQTKQSLVYDLQEPFRWIADVAVLEAFESGKLDLPDFYFTGDDYRYRFEPDSKQRFLDLLYERFNSKIGYNRHESKWVIVIEQKMLELGRYLVGRTKVLDFSEPAPALARTDDMEIRKRVLAMSVAEARRAGITKSTYYHLRRSARGAQSFRIYKNTEHRLQAERN
jgi:CRISPR-associated protein Cas1